MRRAFAIVATLGALACCDAFGSSDDAPPVAEAGAPTDGATTDGGGISDGPGQPAASSDGSDPSLGFCAEANLRGRAILGCEDFEGTDASHGFPTELTGSGTKQLSAIGLGREPNGLVVSGKGGVEPIIAGVIYNGGVPAPETTVRLRFLARVRQLTDQKSAGAAVQVAGLVVGQPKWPVVFYNATQSAATFATYLGGINVDGTPIRSFDTTYEMWLDIRRVDDAGAATAQLWINGERAGGGQQMYDLTNPYWSVRVGAQINQANDEATVEIDDVLLSELQ